MSATIVPKTGKQPQSGDGAAKAPLRLIVDRPSSLRETLECGHTIDRPLSLGEPAYLPSKVAKRRCWKCAANDDPAEPTPDVERTLTQIEGILADEARS